MTSFTTNTYEQFGLFQNWNSIRIPRISRSFNEHTIAQMFNDVGVGFVERVDFVVIPTQETSPFRTAYVHFKSWSNTQIMHDVRLSIDSTGSYRMNFYDGTYCFLQRMTCEPVPTTDQNIHQLAAALTSIEARLRVTEEQLASKSSEHAVAIDQIGEQAFRIADLERRLDEYDEYYENEANENNDETFGGTFGGKASRIADLERRLDEYDEYYENEYNEANGDDESVGDDEPVSDFEIEYSDDDEGDNEAEGDDPRYNFRVTRSMRSHRTTDLEEGDVDEAGFHSSYYTSDPEISTMSLDELAALVQDPNQAFDCGSQMDISVEDDDDASTHSSMPELLSAESDSDDSERMRTTHYLCDNY